jgi:hypothetical protein
VAHVPCERHRFAEPLTAPLTTKTTFFLVVKGDITPVIVRVYTFKKNTLIRQNNPTFKVGISENTPATVIF